jgi:catechol 2,3-dioxygenase-like lactoylglutathione lyase family enzyme
MQLGCFSISLAVKDLTKSRAFYEGLGFEVMGGDHQGYEIMRNGTTVIGLFQGMFEENILTFNPGWNHEGKNVDPFEDVRAIAAKLQEQGQELQHDTTADKESGPASFIVTDPDGNAILIDQHR